MSESAQQYLALVLSDEWVSAAIWQLVDSKISILNHSQTVSVEKDDDSSINQAIDAVLDELGDAGLTLKNVLYILPHHWVKENDLIESKKRFLKALSQDLVLEPLGFVVLTDTILASEGSKHGVDFSGYIINDTKAFWDVAHYEGGAEKKIERIGKSGDLTLDIQELEARLKNAPEPNRVLLLVSPDKDTSEIEKHLQKIFAVSVETLSATQISDIAIKTGGQEVLSGGELEESSSAHEKQAVSRDTTIEQDDDAPLMNAPPAGFAPPAFAHATAPHLEANDLSTDEEVALSSRKTFTEPSNLTDPDDELSLEDEPKLAIDETLLALESKKTTQKLPTWLSSLPFTLPTSASLKNLRVPQFLKKSPLAMIGGGALLLLLIVLGSTYAIFAQTYKTQVDLWLSTEQLEREDEFIIGASGSASQSALTANTFTEEVTLDKEVPTTGSKVIGDAAKGRVKIYNKTTQSKLFPAGTIISSNGITFTLNEDVTIASASSEGNGPQSVTIKSGVGEVDVSAVDIGPEGNLEKATRFTVANFDSSSYEAENESAFSGGAQREIQAVAKSDIDQAVRDLTEAGKTQLVEKIEGTQEEGEYVLFTDEIETTDITPSAEIGSEAKFVSISVTLSGKALRITADELQETAQQLLGDQVGEDHMLLSESVNLEPQSVTVLEEGYQLTAKITGQGVPQLQASSVVSQIQGTYVERARQILQADNRIDRFEITTQPNWMSWIFTRLPSNPERIAINIRIDHSQ